MYWISNKNNGYIKENEGCYIYNRYNEQIPIEYVVCDTVEEGAKMLKAEGYDNPLEYRFTSVVFCTYCANIFKAEEVLYDNLEDENWERCPYCRAYNCITNKIEEV